MPTDAIITLTDPRSAAAEAYRTLRTNLEFASVDHRLQTLLVTSAAPTDGKIGRGTDPLLGVNPQARG